jgi:molybdopterin synthase sulfur carrier subunit
MLKLVFLGRLEDIAGAAERSVPLADDVDSLIAGLEPELARALREPRVRVAVNGALVADRARQPLADGDEIAFLPPVSGG